ncbi:hypothetical protein BOX15_Mlig001149g7 [Macrostomum lignano]|uniref:Uncharacterized protein n=1 Tax=Macrostomum lignano TaxID=282301 RepID=A0A267G100_9PLAT|nr:hypothetical protein BOX15_Mlig001149g7 [Macrostomum lignano]
MLCNSGSETNKHVLLRCPAMKVQRHLFRLEDLSVLRETAEKTTKQQQKQKPTPEQQQL